MAAARAAMHCMGHAAAFDVFAPTFSGIPSSSETWRGLLPPPSLFRAIQHIIAFVNTLNDGYAR